MQNKILELNLINKNGTIKRRIRAVEGRVTVLRAQSDSALAPIINAFSNPTAPDCAAILLDDEQFSPENARLIGLSSSALDHGTLVRDVLERDGINASEIGKLLLDYGLAGKEGCIIGVLSQSEVARLELLSAIKSKSKILIINEPFAQIGEELIEKFAQLLVDHAWSNPAIVLVLKLSHRPKCWLGNELISRIQVDQERSKTIGFGSSSGTADLREEVKALRKVLKQTDAKQQKSYKIWLGTVALAALVLTLVWFSSHREAPVELAKQSTTPVVAPSQTPIRTTLEKFPAEIKAAVISSFEETGYAALPLSEAKTQTAVIVNTPPQQSVVADSSDTVNTEEVAARNAELRKKILDALERNYRQPEASPEYPNE